MPALISEGAALFVGGYGAADAPTVATSALHTLGQIGEALLAGTTPWRVRRLSLVAGERHTPSRVSLKRHIDELADQRVGAVVLAIAGVVAGTDDGPALVTGAQYREYPEDATLALSWIRTRLRACRAERVLVVLSAPEAEARLSLDATERATPHTIARPTATTAVPAVPAPVRTFAIASELQTVPLESLASLPSNPAETWLAALATGRAGHVIAAHASPRGCPAIDALLSGLCGEAIDPATGTVTLRSISQHLERCVPGLAMQPSLASETLASSPPIALRDGRSRRARHLHGDGSTLPPRRTAAGGDAKAEPEDLTGMVLPGRFRIDASLASGSFGTVYRARQLAVDRDVAVKVLHPGLDPSSEDGRLFVQEIQAVGRIDHANVVRIHQADITVGGRLFFAMELLAGRDLQQIINAEKTIPRERAVALTRQLLAGLGAAHDAGLVHADIKPANAFVVAARDRDPERVVLLDFGLARLRSHGEPALSAGGTPAYMAPEQLNDERVDARSDLFAAALVLVTMLTGWRRMKADELAPPLELIEDADLRAVLARAFALAPADRYQTAAELSDALAGKAPATSPGVVVVRPPFRHLAALTEGDGDRLHGRARDVATLTEHVLYRRAVVYTAPSGTGKTSLLRAGLVTRLASLAVRAVYFHCRAGAGTVGALAAAITPGAATVADAIAAWHREHPGAKLVLILDQIDAVLPDPDEGAALVGEALGFDRWPADADVAVVLSVREDFLARLLASSHHFDEGVPVVRLGPLTQDGARDAITGPLAEHRLAIEPELLEVLLADLQRAAAAIGAEMGWGTTAAVYPPHLQLACSVLYDGLAPGEASLSLAHYRRLGGLDAIVGEYLERVLDTELDAAAAVVARDLFLALVSAASTRAFRSDAELIDLLGSKHGAARVHEVLELLRSRGLLVPVRAPGGESGWELIHDSLVPRVLAWIGRRDLARRRALELVRHHLRRSRAGAPSLLTRAELRELRAHDDAIAELDTEWSRRSGEAWTPTQLVSRSRTYWRRRALLFGGGSALLIAIVSIAVYWWSSAATRRAEQALRDRDVGRFVLELSAFEWAGDGVGTTVPVALTELPALSWQLHDVDAADPFAPGAAIPDAQIVRRGERRNSDGSSMSVEIETRGGSAFLAISGRGRAGETCAPSIIQLRDLPGYAQRDRGRHDLRVRFPTCSASRAGTVAIPAGPFVRGGVGEPPSAVKAEYEKQGGEPEATIELAAFAIDRTETSNAVFASFAELSPVTGVEGPRFPRTSVLEGAGAPSFPVAHVSWFEARAMCRFFGKELPTSDQWQKAMRGGLTLAGGAANPMPRRNLPWGAPVTPVPAKLFGSGALGPVAVGTTPGDVSPYGVLDLAGNLLEWTDSPFVDDQRVARGGDWEHVDASTLVDYMAIENPRAPRYRQFSLGMRCALAE